MRRPVVPGWTEEQTPTPFLCVCGKCNIKLLYEWKKLCINSQYELRLVELDDVVYIEACDNCSDFHFANLIYDEENIYFYTILTDFAEHVSL